MIQFKEMILILLVFVLSCKENKGKIDSKMQDIDKQVEHNATIKNDTLVALHKIIDTNYSDYQYLKHFAGHLDDDKTEDIVLVVERKCKEEEANASDESRCRKTVLLINTGELHYKVAAESTTIFECSDCGGAGVGDPMQGVVFDNDTVKFFSFYGAATKTMETTAFVYDTISKKWKQTLFTSEWYNIFDTLPGSEIKQNIEIKTAKDFGDIYFGSD